MNITITFRQMPASAALTSHVQEKVAKLQKFLRQPMSAKVTLSLDRLEHVAEVRVSSGGQHLEAREASDDMYTSVDRVIDKLERQIRGVKGTREAKARRHGVTVRGAVAAAENANDSSLDGPAVRPRTTKVSIRYQSSALAQNKPKARRSPPVKTGTKAR
ncbi:ribosome hibernation-promoting factor, HPF/YfiA family [Myxococcota bacterium]